MKKIAILGCENSHANNFLEYIFSREDYSKEIEIVGVYSNEVAAAKNLNEKYGVPIMENYSDAQGKIDGLIITARHGALHYEYAKPYIDSGVPMFIDKPITVDGPEAAEFMRELAKANIRICGGSSLKHDKTVKELKAIRVASDKTLGGVVRAPLDSNSVYGGFYFYAQHLVEIVLEIFGRYPISVSAKRNGEQTLVTFTYDGFCVSGFFTEHNYVYYACHFSDKTTAGGELTCTEDNNWFRCEFDEFYNLLVGEEPKISYADFISPVFVMNAIERSLAGGKEETVNYINV